MNIVLYLRLSKEDMGDEGESHSITSQRNMLLDFVASQAELCQGAVTILADDGYSGTNQNRPAFQKMLEMARNGAVDCILTKDFSRFSRDHLCLGSYLQEIFPLLGIQLISLQEQYWGRTTPETWGEHSSLDFGFRSILASYYSQDLSQKTRTAKDIRAKQGKNISAKAPYGYEKNAQGQYVPEAWAQQVVRRIFSLASQGVGVMAICQQLNQEKVPRKGETGQNQPNLWRYGAVYRILKEEQYLGKLIYGKSRKISPWQKKQVPQPPEDWIVVENCHQALIEPGLFAQAQQVISPRPRQKTGRIFQEKAYWQGKLFCAVCGYGLARRRSKNPSFFCPTASFGYNPDCFKVKLTENQLEQQVSSQIWAIRQPAGLSAANSPLSSSKNDLAKSRQWAKMLEQQLEKSEKKSQEQIQDFTEDLQWEAVQWQAQALDSTSHCPTWQSFVADKLEKILVSPPNLLEFHWKSDK